MPKPVGKINLALYDECIAAVDAEVECAICLTKGQVRALFPQVEYLHWPTRWYTDAGLTMDSDKIDAFASDLECRLMTCGDGQGILQMVDPVTGTVIESNDGGITWHPDPDDPRNSGIALPPPVTAGVALDKCAAANSGLATFQEYVETIKEQKVAEASLVEFLLIIATLAVGVLVAPAWALLPAIIAGFMQKVFAYTYLEFNAAFDNATYQAILCILDCNIGENGSFNQAGYGQVLGSAGSLPNAIAVETFVSWLRLMTLLGLNNACAGGKTTAFDCESCNCSDNCFFGWQSYDTGYGTSPKTTGTDAHGDYVQWNSIAFPDGTKRVLISNFGTYPANNPNVCCYWEAGLLHHFRVSDDVETVPSSAVGRLCGDGNWTHYSGGLPNNFWAIEIGDAAGSPDFYIRIYADAWGV